MAVKDGLYVVSPAAAAVQQQQQHQQQTVAGKTVTPATAVVTVETVKQQQGPFYLHSPNGTTDDPVKDLFVADKIAVKTTAYVAPPPPPLPAIGLNTMTGKPRSIISFNISYYILLLSCTVVVKYVPFCFFYDTYIFFKLVLYDLKALTSQCNDNIIFKTWLSMF